MLNQFGIVTKYINFELMISEVYMTTNNKIDNAVSGENPMKRPWQKPELCLISPGEIKGGGQTGYHEHSIKSSKATNIAGFQYIFYFNGGGSGLAHHRKGFYYS